MATASNVTTTIMFADVCDSTFLYSRLGDKKAFDLINTTLKRAADLVKRHKGVVLRTKGDDVLCIFSDPFDALQASIAIHSAFEFHQTINPSLSIGINSGPALLSEGDIQGDTVNVAARLAASILK